MAAKKIKDYFSDAKKGKLSINGAAYLEGSLFIEVNGNPKVQKFVSKIGNYKDHTRFEKDKKKIDKLKLEIVESHIEKILDALGTSKSIKMFHPLARWACRLHPKEYQNAKRLWGDNDEFFTLFACEDMGHHRGLSALMITRPRTPAERKEIWSSESTAAYHEHEFKSEREYIEWLHYDSHKQNFKVLNCASGDDDIFVNVKSWSRAGKKLYNTAIKQIAKLEYESKYPELLEMLLLPTPIYNKSISPFKIDEQEDGSIVNGNLLAAEVLTAIGGEEVRDILVDITSSTWEACCKKYLSHIKSKEVKHIFSKMTFSRYANVHDDFDDVKKHFEGIKNLATISLSKLPKLSSDKKTLSVLLKRLESKDIVKRRHAAIALMDAVDEPDLEILWKVTRTFLEWERDRAKHLREEYGGKYR